MMTICAADWTYDLFMDDCRGQSPKDTDSYRMEFVSWLKSKGDDFKASWLKSHKGLYDATAGYVGDAFAHKVVSSDWFSDYYKDAYGQRPHLPNWFYVRAVGLPMMEDMARTFCADPVKDAEQQAKQRREDAKYWD